MAENLKALLLFYVNPASAASKILDRGRLWFAAIAALGVSFLLHMGDIPVRGGPSPLERFISLAPGGWLAPLVIVAAAMVPVIILCRAIGGFGSFSVMMSNDYAPLLMCALVSWAAAYLPLVLARMFFGFDAPIAYLVLNVYFAILVAFCVRTLFGASFGAALGITALGWAAGYFAAWLIPVVGPLLYLLLSPFLLYYLYAAVGSDVRSLGEGLRSRQHFQQQLQAATNNPHDADAHYQLGLIYQKRRQYSEAIDRFERAVAIDKSSAEAHMQLGVIAREQGRFEDAISHLRTAASLDERLGQSDVWRELGAAYFGTGQYDAADTALKKFVDRREYDPEGLYWYGKTLSKLGRTAEAREMFERTIEAVKTMPSHRRAHVRQWGSRAKSEL